MFVIDPLRDNTASPVLIWGDAPGSSARQKPGCRGAGGNQTWLKFIVHRPGHNHGIRNAAGCGWRRWDASPEHQGGVFAVKIQGCLLWLGCVHSPGGRWMSF